MDNVFNINDRLKDKQRKKHEEFHRLRIATVQRIVQCSSCQLTCAMCGSHVETSDLCCPPTSSHPGLNLCEFCRAEYNDFLEMSKLGKSSDMSWHNKQWMGLWSSWENYRKAIKAFRDSKEFRQMLEGVTQEEG